MKKSFSSLNLIQYAVGYVFITAGAMKLLSNELSSTFMNLPLPAPELVMYVVAILEILCGILVLINKEVKKATIPLLVIMIAAILLVKIPILHTGFIHFAFAARLDIVMLVLLYILYNSHHK
ncbi:DoxX family protein [Bacillus sp. HNG]|uniref:DoxX family protein n=1 Tax=Bacillus sp. HNG TaxID=2293325 RepID=UPI000E2EE3FA|nr:DoxX family protein [Bacillus sp. HNG]RFB09648.1 DoxX family protein [Bacillus sp. HNG]